MRNIKRYEVGEMKCSNSSEPNGQALLFGCANRTTISLEFKKGRATHAQVHELDRLLTVMGLEAVEVQTEERSAVGRQYQIRPRFGTHQ